MPPWDLWCRPKPVIPDVFDYLQFPALRPQDAIPARDWAELPHDAISYILRKLDLVELLTGGVAAVCSSWRRSARDEPELWRRIDIRSRFPGDLDDLASGAVCLSAGQCEEFCGQYLDDDFLLFLAHRAPLLRCLRLKLCHGVTNEGFAAAITNFPLLEELELELCRGIDDTGVFQHVARSCPRMKHITYLQCPHFNFCITDPNNDWEALAIASMPELRTLQLFRDTLTNTGLSSIIDNCLHLEFLNLKYCRNIIMDDALRGKCARIKKIDLLPHFEDYRGGFETGRAFIPACWTSRPCYYRDVVFIAEEYTDSDDSVPNEYPDPYCYYLGEDEETNLEHHHRILDKSMRRYEM